MTARECAICYPRGVPCEGECDGLREAMHDVVVGRDVVLGGFGGLFDLLSGVTGPPPPATTIERTKPMCHTCAVNERTEKEYGYADE